MSTSGLALDSRPTAGAPATGTDLLAVAATPGGQPWAAGWTGTGLNGEATITQQWNGTTWQVRPSY